MWRFYPHQLRVPTICQPTTNGINSSPTGIPNLGCYEEWNFIQFKKLNCDTLRLWNNGRPWGKAALGQGSSPAKQLCLCLLFSALVHRVIFGVSSSTAAKERQSMKRESALSEPERELTYIDRSPCPWSLIGLSSCKWKLQVLAVSLVQKPCPDWS